MGGRIGKAFLFAVTVGLLIFFGASGSFQPWRAGLFQAIEPAFEATARGIGRARGWFDGISGNSRAWEEERAQILARLAELEAVRAENATLRAALALRNDGEAGALPAEVVAFLREGRDEYLVLNRGTADGIGIGDIVVNTERVLGGVVVSVDPHAARVILFSSPSRSTDVTLSSGNIRAVARGANARELSIELVPTDATVNSGDLVLASSRATGGRRPLLLGVIREARQAEHEIFKVVRATHLFDPGETSVVVLLAP